MYKDFKFSLLPILLVGSMAIVLFGAGCVREKLVNYIKYVNPIIGTGVYSAKGAMGEINTFPGASMPHGMVQLSPDTDLHIAGYIYDDENIEGFSHTHLTGTGCWGFGNFLLMPTTGELKTVESEYRSGFSHESEVVTPGYYAVNLEDYGIRAELTATTRAGFHRYTFPEAKDAHIIIDITHNLADDDPIGAKVEIIDKRTITGSVTIPNPFCGGKTPFTLYFAAIFSKPFSSYGTWNNDSINEGSHSQTGTDIGAFVDYETTAEERILVKVGISYVSEAQAVLNLEKEIPAWNFERVRDIARKTWNGKLNRIKIEGGTEDNKVKFYTSLYHSLLGPYTASDVNGKYRGMDNKVHTAKGYTYYTVYSIWDTFRSEHPLLNIIEPEVQNDLIKTLLAKQEQGGWIPKWEFANRYTNCMIADHATSVIVESYLKGIRNYDIAKAYYAMRKNAIRLPRSGYISVVRHEGHFSPLQIQPDGKAQVVWFTGDGCKTLLFDWKGKYNDGEWHFYAVTYDSEDKIVIYMDGEPVASTEEGIAPLIISENPWGLGGDIEKDEPSEYYTGNLDEFRIYNHVLSQNQIKQFFKGKISNEGLVLHYAFDERDVSLVSDLSGYGNKGKVRGKPEWEDGKMGNSIVFDGVDDFVRIQNIEQLNLKDKFSLSFWFKTSLPTDFGGRKGLDYYQKYGYIPYDVDWGGGGSVSTTMEDAYDDWALAQMAKDLNKREDYEYFMKRASYYRNLFNSSTGFMRPKRENGAWKKPFDPKDWDEFTEGNSWTYTWFVPHDVQGLINLMGKKSFIEKLDHFFGEFVYPEWDEKFSNYWHGNEPDQQASYFYDYVSEPWKTQKVVREIMDKLYGIGPAGIPGNEDVGQLSAWYVLSAMGFHPVAPPQLTYQIGSPIFEKVTIYLNKSYYNADKFVIEAKNNSKENKYIQSATLNGEPLNKPWFTHSEIKKGGTIIFHMGPEPNREWGSSPMAVPPSMSSK